MSRHTPRMKRKKEVGEKCGCRWFEIGFQKKKKKPQVIQRHKRRSLTGPEFRWVIFSNEAEPTLPTDSFMFEDLRSVGAVKSQHQQNSVGKRSQKHQDQS